MDSNITLILQPGVAPPLQGRRGELSSSSPPSQTGQIVESRTRAVLGTGVAPGNGVHGVAWRGDGETSGGEAKRETGSGGDTPTPSKRQGQSKWTQVELVSLISLHSKMCVAFVTDFVLQSGKWLCQGYFGSQLAAVSCRVPKVRLSPESVKVTCCPPRRTTRDQPFSK